MITISLCMIVKNEESTLERCLTSVESLVDEIIIVDTGSTESTKEIASRFTNKIYDFEWVDDFSAARNFSYEQAEMEYIFWLDADDIILPEDAVKFNKLKETIPPDIDAVMMRYNTGFDLQGKVIFSCFRERLSKRKGGFKWREPVHEYLDTGWKRITADISVTHAKPFGRQNDRNIKIYENLLDRGEELSPRGMYYYARELKDHARYTDSIKYFRLFLDSGQGWVEDNISACGELAKCYLAENMHEEALHSLLRSFNYDTPRAEICCQIGYYFKEQGKYRQAVFWFELILKLGKKESILGFRQEECWGYVPCIELVVCHDKLGEYELAAKFNELAADYKPDSQVVLLNRKYFDRRLGKYIT